jgi:hypothetical protein
MHQSTDYLKKHIILKTSFQVYKGHYLFWSGKYFLLNIELFHLVLMHQQEIYIGLRLKLGQLK